MNRVILVVLMVGFGGLSCGGDTMGDAEPRDEVTATPNAENGEEVDPEDEDPEMDPDIDEETPNKPGIGDLVLTLDPDVAEIEVGEAIQLELNATTQDGGDVTLDDVLWSSANEEIVTVEDGLVRGVGAGVTTVAAEAYDTRVTAQINVIGGPDSLTVEPATVTLWQRDTQQFTAIVTDSNDNVLEEPVEWESGDESIVTIDEGGLAVALEPGFTTITARSGELEGSATITVEPQAYPTEMVRVFISGSEPHYEVGDPDDELSATLTGTSEPLPDNPTFMWESTNEAVATVDANGEISIVGAGTAAIVAWYDGIWGSKAIRVRDADGRFVQANPSAVHTVRQSFFRLGLQRQIAGDASSREDVTDAIWANEHPEILSFDAGESMVHGTTAGTGVMRATKEGLTADIFFVVWGSTQSVTATPNTVDLAPGDEEAIVARGYDSAGNRIFRQPTWSSEDEAVATVDDEGVVTAVGPGSTNIVVTLEAAEATVPVTVQ